MAWAPNGTEFCLRELRKRVAAPTRRDRPAVIWTAVDGDDLARCEAVLRGAGTYVRTGSFDGITAVEGRDPDGAPSSSYPGPGDARPGALAPRIYTW